MNNQLPLIKNNTWKYISEIDTQIHMLYLSKSGYISYEGIKEMKASQYCWDAFQLGM